MHNTADNGLIAKTVLTTQIQDETHLVTLEPLRASCPSCCPPDNAPAPFSERNVDTKSSEAKNIDCEAGALGCPPSRVPIANGMKLCLNDDDDGENTTDWLLGLGSMTASLGAQDYPAGPLACGNCCSFASVVPIGLRLLLPLLERFLFLSS